MGAHKEAYIPATSTMRVTMPGSFFATGEMPPADTMPLALPLGFSAISWVALTSLLRGVRSCLLEYSEDGSRRRGVACFVRAMGTRGWCYFLLLAPMREP